jgi:hypothetical protein
MSRKRIVEVKTIGYRQERAGYGSSAQPGDAYQPLLPVPSFIPTSGQRYLFRLCAAMVAANEEARVVSFKLTSLIGQRADVRIVDPPPGDSWTYLVEREMVSPFWSFVDGNVTYYFRSVPIDGRLLATPAAYPPSVNPNLHGVSPSLLALTYDPAAREYTSPGGGSPPGDPIGGLDTIREQPGVWSPPSPIEDYVKGPCVITMFASVLQTDPQTRPYLPAAQYPSGAFSQGLRPEDEFLLSWGDTNLNRVQYTAVAGAFRVEYREKQPCKETP